MARKRGGSGYGLLAMVMLTVAWIASPAMGKFVVEKNNLGVNSPDNIKGTYDSAIGNFGIPQYGGSMIGTAAYREENHKGCQDFENVDFKPKPGGLPTIVLVDRGGKFSTFLLLFLNYITEKLLCPLKLHAFCNYAISLLVMFSSPIV